MQLFSVKIKDWRHALLAIIIFLTTNFLQRNSTRIFIALFSSDRVKIRYTRNPIFVATVHYTPT